MQKNILILPLLLIAGLFLFGCTNQGLNSLTIKVVDQSGNPLPGVNVNIYSNYSLSSNDSFKWSSLNGSIQSSASTTENGTASFTLPASKYAVNAYKSSYYNNGQEVLLDSSKEIKIIMYPINSEQLAEKLNNNTYTVTETIKQSGQNYVSYEFSPEIKRFSDTGADDLQVLIGNNGTKYRLCQILDNKITYVDFTQNCNASRQVLETMTGTGYKITVGVNQAGLYLIRAEEIK